MLCQMILDLFQMNTASARLRSQCLFSVKACVLNLKTASSSSAKDLFLEEKLLGFTEVALSFNSSQWDLQRAYHSPRNGNTSLMLY